MQHVLKRTPSSDGESSDSKRPRLFRACAQCVQAKSRCEEVRPSGCRGCRKKHKQCSLAGTVVASAAPSRRTSDRPAAPATPDPLLAHRLDDAEERAAMLESRVAMLERQVLNNTLAPAPTPARVDPTAVPLRHPLFEPNLSTLYRSSLNVYAHMFTAYSDEPYADVVALGLVGQDQVDMAFQLFKHRVCDALPLAALTHAATPTPRHPFVVLAFLQHVPSLVTPALRDLVHRAVALAMAGAISAEVMLALLILALAPEAAVDDRPCPHPTRLISLARDIGIEFEFGGPTGKRRVEGTFDVGDIWTAVCTKYVILHAAQAQIGALVRVTQPAHVLGGEAEAALLSLVFRTVTQIDALERDLAWMGDVQRARNVWFALVAEWNAYRGRATGSLLDDATAILFALHLRISLVVHDIPSPLMTIRQTLRECSHGIPATIRACLELVVDRASGGVPLPAHIAHTAATAIITGRRSIAVVLAHYPDVHEPIISFDLVEEAERALLALGGASARLVRSTVHHLGPVSALRELASGNAANAAANVPINLDLDWLFWDPAFLSGVAS